MRLSLAFLIVQLNVFAYIQCDMGALESKYT